MVLTPLVFLILFSRLPQEKDFKSQPVEVPQKSFIWSKNSVAWTQISLWLVCPQQTLFSAGGTSCGPKNGGSWVREIVPKTGSLVCVFN